MSSRHQGDVKSAAGSSEAQRQRQLSIEAISTSHKRAGSQDARMAKTKVGSKPLTTSSACRAAPFRPSPAAYLDVKVGLHEHVPVLQVPPEHVHLEQVLVKAVAVRPARPDQTGQDKAPSQVRRTDEVLSREELNLSPPRLLVSSSHHRITAMRPAVHAPKTSRHPTPLSRKYNLPHVPSRP